MSEKLKIAVLVVVLALSTAACWWGWLAWDNTYQIDPLTGNESGPYEAWQVIGCVVSLVVIGSGAALLLPAWVVIVTMTLAFTAAWTATAQSQDETGLFMVGAVLVLVAMAGATGVLTFLVQAIARRRRARTAS